MSETASIEIVRQAFLDTGKQILANRSLHAAQHAHPSMRDVGVPIRFDLEMFGYRMPIAPARDGVHRTRDATPQRGNVVTIGRR